jgi:hypothetical protein
VNNMRVIQYGGTVVAIGQLFDPNDLADPALLTNPAEIAMHCFDRVGLLPASNDDIKAGRRDQGAPADCHPA